MDLKAFQLFFRATMVLFTMVVLIFCILGLLSSDADPNRNLFMPFIGLALPGILLIAFSLIIFWLFNKSYWAVIPLLSIIINYQFIASMVHVNLFSEKDTEKIDSIIKIATYNIHGFNYIEDEFPVSYIVDCMYEENVKILCMQEFMPHSMQNMSEVINSFDFLPYHSIHKDSSSEIGLAIFSKYPILRGGKIHFESTANGAQWVDIDIPDGKTIRVINVHFQTTGLYRSYYLNLEDMIKVLGQNFKRRAVQANIIRSIIDSTEIPVILCGDFNDIPSSYVYKRAKGDLIDGFKEAGSGFGSTFLNKANMFRLDYIMHSDALKGVRYYSRSLKWSDHNPIFGELEYRN